MCRLRLIAHLLVAVCIFLVASPLALLARTADRPYAAGDMPQYVPGEVIVKFRPATGLTTPAHAKAISEEILGIDIKSTRKLYRGSLNRFRAKAEARGIDRIFVLQFDTEVDPAQVAEALQKNAAVTYAQPNYLYRTQGWYPDDPQFTSGTQWALDSNGLYENNQNQCDGAYDADVDAPEGWEIERGDSNVAITIIDTGVEYTHEDLGNKVWHNPGETPGDSIDNDGNGYIDDWRGWDFIDLPGVYLPDSGCAGADYCCIEADCTEQDNDPMDGHSHGTKCAGVAAAQTDNGLGIAGLCPDCKIMMCRACFHSSSGAMCHTDAIIEAIYYATEAGSRVLSMSFCGPAQKHQYDYAYYDAIGYAYRCGVLPIGAAGNNNSDCSYNLCYPAQFDSCLAVGGSDWKDQKWTSSPTSGSNYGDWIDMTAPSYALWTTARNNAYSIATGTSLAAPMVAGLAGLLFSQDPSRTNEDVWDILTSSSESIDCRSPGYEGLLGSGRISVWRALSGEFTPPDTVRVPVPFASIQAAIDFVHSPCHKAHVLVGPGTYTENVYLASNIVLKSEYGPASTRIAPSAGGTAIVCRGTDSTAAIVGFTIEGGHADFGGAILCQHSAPRIEGNIIVGNIADVAGGAIAWCEHSAPRILNNTIVGNSAPIGSGIYCGDEVPAAYSEPWGDIIPDTAYVTNNIIANGTGSGICCDATVEVVFSCNDIWNNSGTDLFECAVLSENNFSADPRFCDLVEYFIHEESPCGDTLGCDQVGAYAPGCWTSHVGEPDPTAQVPTGLLGISPSPFTGRTTVTYSVDRATPNVRIAVYDVTGRLVRTVREGYEAPGIASAAWDGTCTGGTPAQPGTYFIRFQASDRVATRKVVLVR